MSYLDAALSRDPVEIERLLDLGGDPNERWELEEPVLSVALRRGNARVVEHLLRVGADATVADAVGTQPIHRVCAHPDSVRFLPELRARGGQLDARGFEGRTPLLEAAAARCEAGVRALLRAGASLDETDNRGRSALWVTAEFAGRSSDANAVDVARTLLERGADVEVEMDLIRPLHLAASIGCLPLVKLLLDHGASVDGGGLQRRSANGIVLTPLQRATLFDHDAVREHLVSRGATIDAWSATALGKRAALEALLDADPELVRDRGAYPRPSLVALAVHFGRTEILEVLLSRGATPGGLSPCGSVVLCAVQHHRSPGLTKRLLTAGAAPDHGDADGRTPLLIAVQRDALDLARLLLEHGADPDAWSERSGTPRECCRSAEMRTLLQVQ